MSSPNIAISIGGSGARTAEALLYLCAAGLGPDSMTLVFVDADTNNGSLTKAKQLAELYTRLQPEQSDSCPLFRTRISLTTPPAWTPFPAGQGTPKLSGFFDFAGMQHTHPPLSHLMQALYTQDHRDAKLDDGFLGKPSIGAAVLGHAINTGTPPWDNLIASMNAMAANAQQVSIFAMGSIFGGTGAAGLPTIPKLLKDSVSQGKANVCVGAALLLPYFDFPPPPKQIADTEPVYASPDTFLINSKEALRHYHSLDTLFDRLYMFGTGKLARQRNFKKGGQEQDNLPHFVELVAASGATDFFRTAKPGDSSLRVVATESDDAFGWKDHPEHQRDRPALADLARLSFFFLDKVMPRLEQIKTNQPGSDRTPWYRHLIARRDVSLSDAKEWRLFEDLDLFSKRFLVWLRELQSNNGNVNVKLVDPAPIAGLTVQSGKAQLSQTQFKGDLLPNGHVRRVSISDMWVRLCEHESVRSSTLNNRRAFESALYAAAKGA